MVSRLECTLCRLEARSKRKPLKTELSLLSSFSQLEQLAQSFPIRSPFSIWRRS